ncbi:MAG: methylenetetrahydrofolate reductase [Chloroflexi bacterium OLB14]|nr:MAG: methylenetetrahydrofolate reductase [Chloroflexi bacterium OLB14]
MAKYMNEKIPGVFVPQKIMQRMEVADQKGNAEEEGIHIALELIERIKSKQGVNGIHIMSVGWEESVPRIIEESELLATNN